jgi:topoisomerase-4 subunit A
VLDRIHILEGRQLVLLNIDEVIAIIRQSDEPKAALIARFSLSDRQAEDILEIRLRQLARLEAIKIEQELAESARRTGQAGRHSGQPRRAQAVDGARDRGRRQNLCR